MIDFELIADGGILLVKPAGPLFEADFTALAVTVDPYIAKNGKLVGLLIDAPSFPDWDGFAGLLHHFRSVRDHHRNIERVAAVTDNAFLKIMLRIAEHFARPEIKVFPGTERADALELADEGGELKGFHIVVHDEAHLIDVGTAAALPDGRCAVARPQPQALQRPPVRSPFEIEVPFGLD